MEERKEREGRKDDLPSVVSGDSLGIIDPHEKYFSDEDGRRSGIRWNLTGDAVNMRGLQLLPLSNKTFADFMKKSSSNAVYIDSPVHPKSLLPGMQAKFLDSDIDVDIKKKLENAVRKGYTQLRNFDKVAVENHLRDALPTEWTQSNGHNLPVFLMKHRTLVPDYVNPPNPKGVLDALMAVVSNPQSMSVSDMRPLGGFLSRISTLTPKERDFLKKLQLFNTHPGSGGQSRHVSLLEVPLAAPVDDFPPVRLCTDMVDLRDGSSRTLAQLLGTAPMSHVELVKIMLNHALHGLYSDPDIDELVEYTLNRLTMFHGPDVEEIKRLLTCLPFIMSGGNTRKKPGELFDPEDKNLTQMFLNEPEEFPKVGSYYAKSNVLVHLRALGLKKKTDVTASDILFSARMVNEIQDVMKATTKSKAILERLQHLLQHKHVNSTTDLLSQLNSVPWVPVFDKRSETYPTALLRKNESSFACPKDATSAKFLYLVGSSKTLVDVQDNSQVSHCFGWNIVPSIDEVISHLKNVIFSYEEEEKNTFISVIKAIYRYLASQDIDDVIGELDVQQIHKWVWNGDGFSSPSEVTMRVPSFNLQPYLCSLPSETKKFATLFSECGMKLECDNNLLLNILRRIKERHELEHNHNTSCHDVKRDLQYSIDILNALKPQNGEPLESGLRENLLVPVNVEYDTTLELVPVDECTYCDREWLKQGHDVIDIDDTDDVKIKFIHRNIPTTTAEVLGVPTLMSRILDADELDMGESFGQSESLLDRLKGLLEGYTDGLSVPKELIQNADDAGATEVRFLYDERTNDDAMTHLLDEGMKECQGPALWSYNDAVFTNDDFQNIVKLNAATKEEDTGKIGRFGLGFNSVYNLTDVPSFVSRESIVILDPHTTYLGKAIRDKSKPGYPCDGSIMKELLQNADDAMASKICFIKDPRQHPDERVFEDSWKPLQGPALCVYNNAPFTNSDIKGIQNLGEGSKGDDPNKTGQYGIGFNAVYHLTDVPTFISKGKEIGEVMCVFDPNLKYAPCASPESPGVMYEGLEYLRERFTDVLPCFLEQHFPIDNGTMFRFPLRDEKMAETSKISSKPMTTEKLNSLMNNFQEEILEALLFVNSVKEISICEIEDNGNVKTIFHVEASMSAEDEKKRQEFSSYAKAIGNQLQRGKMSITKVPLRKVSYVLHLKDSRGLCQDWLVVQQIGWECTEDICQEVEIGKAYKRQDLGLLPRGGVACLISSSSTIKPPGKAYCFLPLPFKTGLPIHINGHFALDHEARRALWRSETGDYRSKWNDILLRQVVAPCYVVMLEEIRQFISLVVAEDNRTYLRGGRYEAERFLSYYESFFPSLNLSAPYWKVLAIDVYRHMNSRRSRLLPVLHHICTTGDPPREEVIIEWFPPTGEDHDKVFFDNIFNEQLKFLTSQKVEVISKKRNDDVEQRLDKNQSNDFQDAPVVINVMTHIYQFLETNLQNNESAIITGLQKTRCIVVEDGKRFVDPRQIVADMMPDDEIYPYLFRVPRKLAAYSTLFEKLGATSIVTPAQYAMVLDYIRMECRDGKLDPNETTKAFKATKGLFESINKNSGVTTSDLPSLYLPGVKRNPVDPSTKLVFLRKSTEIFYNDAPHFKERLEGFERLLFVKLKECELIVDNDDSLINQLPESIRPRKLTSFVHETLVENGQSATFSSAAQELRQILTSNEFCFGLTRLIKHASYERDMKTEEGILRNVQESLSCIHVYSVPGLRTRLVCEGTTIPESEAEVACFEEKTEEGSQEVWNIYVEQEVDLKEFTSRVAEIINRITGHLLGEALVHLPMMLLKPLVEIRSLLDSLKIREDNTYLGAEATCLPTLGNFIHIEDHHLLVHAFTVFYPGEYVGYELDDPSLRDEDGAATYIYAIIIEEVPSGEKASPITKRYRINIGKELIDVDAVDLYKFFRRKHGSEGLEIEVFTGSETAEEQEVKPDNLDEAKRQVRETLEEAWHLPEEKRKKIIKRLFLAWHPDKNPGNEEFCTEVFKFIQAEIKRLETGADPQRAGNFGSSGGYGNFSSCYNRWSDRAREHGSQRSRNSYFSGGRSSYFRGGCSSSSHRCNPQPGEAARWYRQATKDFNAASNDVNENRPSYEWACFKCHQSAEKALKAAQYSRDADRSSTHNLSGIASSLGNSELISLAHSMECLLGDSTRMRYPDRVRYPKIPHDIYTRDMATQALKLARKIINVVKANFV
ncbi:hypothetical protein QZH41_001319 [Actinostola sp. cb2023]|nr:hypothetical protein QZH41_001319 [Actinostola sp. cb2023]